MPETPAERPALNPRKVGVAVECVVCRNTKAPIGRSIPLGLHMCDDDCAGYRLAPHVGSLWPQESEADFGYPVQNAGTEIQ